jgi:CHAT domain-containing protein/Flp pilus assembly protein TadD
LYREARLAFDSGELDHAMALGKEGRRQFGEDEKWRELFTIVIAESLSRNNKIDEAVAELRHAPRSGDPEAAVRLLMAYGYVRDGEAQYARADALAAKDMPSLQPEIAVRRAGPAMWKNDADAMERFAREALQRVNPVEQPFVYVNARVMVASAAMKRGDYQQAIEGFRSALRLAHVVGAKGTASTVVGNLGFAYMQLGDADEALANYEEALRVARQQGNIAVQITWLANIANVFIAQQRPADALTYGQESVAVATALGDEQRLALALNNLAQVEIELGRYADARNHNDTALALYRKLNVTRDEQYALLNQARIDGAIGSSDAALEALTMLASRDDLPLRWNAQAVMARIYQRQGRRQEAERMYQAALDTGDFARVESKSDVAYLFAFEANLIRFYDEAIDLLLDEGRIVDALQVAERSRARTLRRQGAEPLLAATALARQHDATILSYWLAAHRSLLWVVTGERVSVIKLPAGPIIANEIDAYRNEIIRGRTSTRSARGTQLFDLLVAPALPAVRSGRVIIVADGPLSGINLETLIVSKPQPHYWIEDVTLSYTPSLHFLGAARSTRSFGSGQALIMGDVSEQGPNFPQLRRAGLEIERVARHFDPRRRVVITGTNATPAAYLTAKLSRFYCVHFVAHGTASVRSPLESSVILAGGGRLTGHEIIAAPLDAELVTVSSCNSAGRRSYAGEGLVGLAWAFLDAGAHRVIAAQWDVSDTATPQLMDDMYGGLAAGRDPANALREAKLALLHSKSVYERPFYWAPFILYGAP